MGLLQTIAAKAAGAVGWTLVKELRQLRRTLEVGIDSYREAHHLTAAYGVAPAPVAQDDPEPPPAIAEGTDIDFLRMDMIEELAREQRVPFDETTDLLALAVTHGWITPQGEMRMLPAVYKDLA